MKTFTPQTFDIPSLKGISKESVDQHIALYQGYVKNFNAIHDALHKLAADEAGNALALSELHRRLSFEFGGMRLHEYYFRQFEGGAKQLDMDSALGKMVAEQHGNPEKLIKLLKAVASLRGPGWALLYYDPVSEQLLTGFSGEQHQGHFVTLPIVLALDVWEHTYILDHGASGKGKYVDAFFENINWQVCEENFSGAKS